MTLGMGAGVAGLGRLGLQASSGVVSPVLQASPLPLHQAPAGCPLSHTEFLCVGGRKEGGRGPGQTRWCVRPYLLGVGRWVGAWRTSFTKPALSPLAAAP